MSIAYCTDKIGLSLSSYMVFGVGCWFAQQDQGPCLGINWVKEEASGYILRIQTDSNGNSQVASIHLCSFILPPWHRWHASMRGGGDCVHPGSKSKSFRLCEGMAQCASSGSGLSTISCFPFSLHPAKMWQSALFYAMPFFAFFPTHLLHFPSRTIRGVPSVAVPRLQLRWAAPGCLLDGGTWRSYLQCWPNPVGLKL